MLLSLSFVSHCKNEYDNCDENIVENFTTYNNPTDNFAVNKSMKFYRRNMYMFSIFILIIELILFYYAMLITINCSKNRSHFIVNFLLGLVFTAPFVLLNIVSNKCVLDLFEQNKI